MIRAAAAELPRVDLGDAYGDYPFDETARPVGYRPLRQPATAKRDAIAANRV